VVKRPDLTAAASLCSPTRPDDVVHPFLPRPPGHASRSPREHLGRHVHKRV